MKRVVSESTVAHLWANQLQSDARNARNTFYFKNATIYSYGSHFPIATILNDGTVLFTTRDYSNTTSGHKYTAKHAVSHKNIILVRDVPTTYNETATKKNCNQISCNQQNISNWIFNITELLTALSNPKNRNISGRVASIDNELSQLNAYLNYFGEKSILKTLSPDLKKLLRKTLKVVEKSREDWANRIAIAEEREKNRTGLTDEEREANRIKREAKEERDWQTFFALWQSYNDDAIRDLPESVKKNAIRRVTNSNWQRRSFSFRHGFTDQFGFTRLRYNASKQRVETSKGVEIPVAIAQRVYNKIKNCTDCKELEIDVVGYTLTAANTETITAGCHTIPQSDVKYIAQLLNWN